MSSSVTVGDAMGTCTKSASGRQSEPSRYLRQRVGNRRRPRGRRPRGIASRSKGTQTAYECSAEDIPEVQESVLLCMAQEYVTSIQPEPSTLVVPSSSESCQVLPPSPSVRRRPSRGRVAKRKRQSYSVDHFVVTESQRDRCGLAPGTMVLRPAVKLVELVAQAIYYSPNGLLRVSHIYDALQRKYPYFMFLPKKALTSWKSSIRHALFQRWFIKLRISSETTCRRTRCSYWGLNYESRPREWTMPGISCHGEPAHIEAVDVKPFGEDLVDALLDDSTTLDWLLPLEVAEPILGIDGRPLELVPYPSASTDGHQQQQTCANFQQLSAFTDMDVGAEDTERPPASSHSDVASTTQTTGTCPPTCPCSVEGSAEWLTEWTAEWPADWWWMMPLSLPSASGGSSAANERQSRGTNTDFVYMD